MEIAGRVRDGGTDRYQRSGRVWLHSILLPEAAIYLSQSLVHTLYGILPANPSRTGSIHAGTGLEEVGGAG